MKLYPKRLDSVKALKRERQRLLREKEELEDEPFFSAGALKGMVGGGAGILSAARPALKILQRFSNRFRRRSETEPASATWEEDEAPKAKDHNAVVSLLKDVLFAYLKWKAIEFTYKAIMRAVKKKK